MGCRIHYSNVIMGKWCLESAASTVYLSADLWKNQSSPPLAFVRGIHRGPVNSPHNGPVTRKMFPFDDVIMAAIGDHRTVDEIYRWPIASCNAVIWYKDKNQDNCPSDTRHAKVPMKKTNLYYFTASQQHKREYSIDPTGHDGNAILPFVSLMVQAIVFRYNS